jgi:hypothetical protein
MRLETPAHIDSRPARRLMADGPCEAYFICAATKSQLTSAQNASTYFGRALR